MKKLLFLLVAALSTTFSMNAVSLDTLFEYAESEIGGELTTITGDQMKMIMALAGQQAIADKAQGMRMYSFENATVDDMANVVALFTAEEIDDYTAIDEDLDDGDLMWMRVNTNTGRITGMLMLEIEENEISVVEMEVSMTLDDLSKMAK